MSEVIAVKERPILFSGEMVRAILEGRKTQTRRVVSVQPPEDADSVFHANNESMLNNDWKFQETNIVGIKHDCTDWFKCPYGKPGDKAFSIERPKESGWYDVIFDPGESMPIRAYVHVSEHGICWGWNESDDPEAIELDVLNPEKIQFRRCGDRLWVRETFCLESNFNIDDEIGYPPPFKDNHPIKWTEDEYFGKCWEQPHYRATDPEPELCVEGQEDPGVRWKPSIFMPRWASRIDLEITGIRVERVQDISEAEAKAEGITEADIQAVTKRNQKAPGVLLAFQYLWDSINAKRGYPWKDNPWVWVVEFKRVTA